jgi:nitroimidazol reductase NimA-like FMN-containing flavoprotein (pyridoxamine 5'-phosphate oxidase superfamily)
MAGTQQKHVKVHDFLKRNPLGVLSTVSPGGEPWGGAIYYVADEDFNFYFVTRTNTAKYHNLDKSPMAALTVADPASQTTVQASGKVSKVPVEDYMDIVFDKLARTRSKGGPHWTPPIEKLRGGNYMPLKLIPDKLHYADYGRDKTDPHAEYIERIIDGA